MKRIPAFILVAVLLCGCTTRTEHGPCVGAFDEKDPAYVYKLSGWNIAMGFLFFELIAPPIVVAVDETFCPIERKDSKQ